MEPKYHINNDGIVGLCRAVEKSCPYIENGHYSSKIEADKAAYNMFGTNYTPPFILDKINELSAERRKTLERDEPNRKSFIRRSLRQFLNLFNQ